MRSVDTTREEAVLRAVELYHVDGMTQATVAERMGCTRWTVGRLLAEAEERGMLKVRIVHPHARRIDLEEALVQRFGLVGARVVPTQDTAGETLILVARQAANYLRDLRPLPTAMAVGWGRTVATIARAMPDQWAEGVIVAQACGVPGRVTQLLGAEVVNTLATRSGGKPMPLHAPNIASSADIAAEIKADPLIEATLEAATRAEVGLYSPGVPEESTILVRCGCITTDELAEASRRGATASVLGRFVNQSGEEVWPSLSHRTIGLTVEQMRDKKLLVSAGFGEEKMQALRSVILAGLAHVAVTDSWTAERMLESD